jgi:hypothetical protein
LAMVAALMPLSIGDLARLLHVYLLQQAFPDSSDGGARVAVRLLLALVYAVVTRLSK